MKRLTSLADASLEVLGCRSMGHAWTHATDTDLNYHAGHLLGANRYERCLRCTSYRVRELDLVNLTIGHARMKYADGYLAARGTHFTRIEAIAAMYLKIGE